MIGDGVNFVINVYVWRKVWVSVVRLRIGMAVVRFSILYGMIGVRFRLIVCLIWWILIIYVLCNLILILCIRFWFGIFFKMLIVLSVRSFREFVRVWRYRWCRLLLIVVVFLLVLKFWVYKGFWLMICCWFVKVRIKWVI